MNIKIISSLITREIRAYLKSLIVISMLVLPVIITFTLGFFMPSSKEKTYIFAVNKISGQSIVDELANYGNVELFNSFEEVYSRVLKRDDAIGIDILDNKPYILLEGNEPLFIETYAKLILKNHQEGKRSKVFISDIGLTSSPLIFYLTSGAIIISIFLSGLIIGLSILRERLNKTISMVLVSPVTKLQFLITKCLPAFFIPLINLYLIIRVMPIINIDYIMLFSITLAASLSSILIGFIIAFLSKSQISAANYAVIVFIIITGSVAMFIFSPQKYHGFVYWSPFYWSFTGVYNILNESFVWRDVLKHLGLCLILNIAYITVLKDRVFKSIK